MKNVLTTLFMAALLTFGMARAQDKKPVLTPEVALEIRNMQWEQAKIQMQMDAIKAQYLELQNQTIARGQELKGKLDTAVKRSGLDEKKYELNPDTLAVTEKPVPTPKPEEKKK